MGLITHPFFANQTIPLEKRAEKLCQFAISVCGLPEEVASPTSDIMKEHANEFPQVEPGVVYWLISLQKRGMTDEAIWDQVRGILIRANTILEGLPDSEESMGLVCSHLLASISIRRLDKVLFDQWIRIGLQQHKPTWEEQLQILCSIFNAEQLHEILKHPTSYTPDLLGPEEWKDFSPLKPETLGKIMAIASVAKDWPMARRILLTFIRGDASKEFVEKVVDCLYFFGLGPFWNRYRSHLFPVKPIV
jgi:hypothetical protein